MTLLQDVKIKVISILIVERNAIYFLRISNHSESFEN